MISYEQYKADIPEQKKGQWEIKQFEVTPEAEKFEKVRSLLRCSHRYVKAGNYTGLFRNGSIIMSDTPDEINDHLPFIDRAKNAPPNSTVLINGLGLGIALNAALSKNESLAAIVIEIDADVISMVSPVYKNKYKNRLIIIHADAFQYKPKPKSQFVAVWHDIWDNICEDNLTEMTTLHRRYGHYTSWQDSWCKAECIRP